MGPGGGLIHRKWQFSGFQSIYSKDLEVVTVEVRVGLVGLGLQLVVLGRRRVLYISKWVIPHFVFTIHAVGYRLFRTDSEVKHVVSFSSKIKAFDKGPFRSDPFALLQYTTPFSSLRHHLPRPSPLDFERRRYLNPSTGTRL